jgi:hypothetical protein
LPHQEKQKDNAVDLRGSEQRDVRVVLSDKVEQRIMQG